MISVAIFGSIARGDNDAVSDKDALVIGDGSAETRLILSNLEREGYDVSIYSRPAFEKITDSGALFMQHLKLESRIIRDDNSFLRAELDRYSVKLTYRDERVDARRYIKSIPKPIGKYWYDLCLADIAYTFFRNYMILLFADISEFYFSFPKIIDNIPRFLPLDKSEVEDLCELRTLKRGYRSRVEGLQAISKLSNLLSAIDDIIFLDKDMCVGSVQSGSTTDDYFKLRMMELTTVRHADPRDLDKLDEGDSLGKLWKSLMGPRDYPRPRPWLN